MVVLEMSEHFSVRTKVISIGVFLAVFRMIIQTPFGSDQDLISAAHRLSYDSVDQAVKDGANLNREGVRALGVLASHPSEDTETILDIMRLLLEAGVAPDPKNTKNRHSALNSACLKGKVEVAQLLIAYGADPKRGTNSHSTGSFRHCLSAAATNDHHDLMEYILENKLVSPTLTDGPTGYNTLHRAAEWGRFESVRLVLKYMSVEDAELPQKPRNFTDGLSALMLAAREGHMDIVRLLVEFGCDPLQNGIQGSALDIVAWSGVSEMRDIVKKAKQELAGQSDDSDRFQAEKTVEL